MALQTKFGPRARVWYLWSKALLFILFPLLEHIPDLPSHQRRCGANVHRFKSAAAGESAAGPQDSAKLRRGQVLPEPSARLAGRSGLPEHRAEWVLPRTATRGVDAVAQEASFLRICDISRKGSWARRDAYMSPAYFQRRLSLILMTRWFILRPHSWLNVLKEEMITLQIGSSHLKGKMEVIRINRYYLFIFKSKGQALKITSLFFRWTLAWDPTMIFFFLCVLAKNNWKINNHYCWKSSWSEYFILLDILK